VSEDQKNVTEDGTLPTATGEAAGEREPLVEQEISALNKEIETLGKEVEDWRSRAYRGAADLDNFRKRALKERDELRKYAIEGVLKDLIPVADNLERALTHAGASGGALADGVAMISKQFLGGLEKHGAKPFDPKGQQFDPQFHEAMSQMPREGVEAGTVIEVYQRGWMLHDRLVRPAMVVIASGEPGGATGAGGDSPDTVETAAVGGEEG
jgi:molecular chaperone GrpE